MGPVENPLEKYGDVYYPTAGLCSEVERDFHNITKVTVEDIV